MTSRAGLAGRTAVLIAVASLALPLTWAAATEPTGSTSTAGSTGTTSTEATPTPRPRSVAVTRSSVPAGASFDVSGQNWPVGAEVSVRLHEDTETHPLVTGVVSPPADENGTFTVPVPVPASTAVGDYLLVACQPCAVGGTRQLALFAPPVPVHVSAAVATWRLSPGKGSAGDTVTATGAGWNNKFQVRLFTHDATCESTDPFATVQPEPTFTFNRAVTVPELDVGAHQFIARQCEGSKLVAEATAAFTLVVVAPPGPPTLVLAPTSAAVGDTVTATGVRWNPAGGTVQLFRTKAAVCRASAVLAKAPARSDHFALSFRLPPMKVGARRFVAAQCNHDREVASAVAAFTVVDPPVVIQPHVAGFQDRLPPGGWAAVLILLLAVLVAAALIRRGQRRPRPATGPLNVTVRLTDRLMAPSPPTELRPSGRPHLRLVDHAEIGPAITTEVRR